MQFAAPLAAFDPWTSGFTGLAPEWEAVLGRLHPPLVHMPIGLLVAAGLFALLGGVSGRLAPTARACLGLGLLGSLAAAASGWLFALHDLENDVSVDDHRWAGLAVVGLALLAWFLGARAQPESGRAALARWLTVALAGLTLFAGHQGGELVWGEDFATAPLEAAAEEKPAAVADAADAAPEGAAPAAPAEVASSASIDFVTQIQPILETTCYRCHGTDRQRGDLRLDAAAHVFDAEMPVIVRGNPNQSELLRRVLLPDTDRDRMPPKGDRLPPEQAQLLERWIAMGAPWPEGG